MTAALTNKLSDPTVERIVLAGIYSFGQDVYLDVADLLSAESFTDKTNQALYKCFKYLLEDKEISVLDESSLYSAKYSYLDCET